MKKNKLQFLVYILLWISNVIPVFAQISLDGTVGTLGQSNLTGPDYEIKSEYGKQAGNNLFHSFSQFNLNTNEVADFQVSSGIQNIVSRITGGSSSWIDGTLRCTIAGTYKLSIANLYLLNPSGVMLGPNANLDINGSFHISTANYLRLGENERFNAEPLKGEVLSVKAPSAFGFLDNDIAPITLEGKGELKWYEWDGEPTGLKVLNGKTISVIGGDIEVKKGTYYYNNRYNENVPLGIINAPEGRVNIVSVASAGEVIPMESDLDVSSCEEMGNIIVSEDSSISVSGEGAGNIYIRGGQFAIDNSFIEAETHGNKNGGVIDIQADRLLLKNGCISGNTSEIGRGGDINIFASDSVYLLNDNSDSYFAKIVTHANGENNDSGDGGNILIETNKLLLEDCAGIASLSKGGGNSGDITIRASEVTLINNDINLYKPIISTAAEGQITTSGGAGNIYIESKMLSLNKGTAINSSTIGIGKGGDITICAYDSVNLSGNAISDGEGSAIVANSYSKEDNTGDTGNILITTKNLLLNDGAQISSSSSSGIGNGGNITIRAFESVSLKGNDDYHGEQEERGSGQGSTILTIGYGGNANTGEGGNILIETKKLSLDNGAQINSSTLGGIDGGDITIYVSELISLSGKDVMSDEHPSTIFSRTESKETDASDAGNILIETERLLLNDGTWISSSSTGKGRGGDVAIIASESIYMSGENINGYGSVIDARADGEIENAGDAGSVLIKTKNLTITDKGEISTSTEGGGNANDVILEISQLHLDNGASISSASDLAEGKGGDAGRIIIGKVIETEQLFKLTDTSLEKLKTEGVSEATIIQLETLQGEDYKNQGDFTNTLKKTIGEDQAVQYESLILEHAEKANGEIIKLEPSDSILIQNGSITTKAKNAGGGKIYIHAKDKIHLQDSHINSDVEQGERKGGDITIGFKTDDQNDNGEGPKLTILDNSDITANADIGDGGAIFIYTDNYISSSDSNLSASSNRGNDGIIKISVPETDISDDLAVMPSNLIDATRWLTLCEERIGEKSSHFILSGRDGIPTSPDDYLTSPPIRLNLQRLKNLEELTQLLTNGEEFFNKGDFENAIQNWEQATPLLDTQKNIYVHTMVYLANAYQATGHHQKAKTALLDALPNINNHYGKTLIFSTLSDIFLSLKNMEQAEEYLEKSIEQADLTDNSHITAFTLNNKGNFLFADGDDYGAITAYEKCYEKCVEITEPSADILGLASKCSINKLRAKLESETDENIVSELAHAISQAGRQPNSHSKSSDFITLSILAQKIGKKPDYSHRINPSLVYSLLSKAIKIAEHTQDIRMACYAYGYMGNLYENEEQYTEAIQLTRNAIFTAQQGHFPELLYLWQWQLGRLFKTEGDIDSAVSTYKDAVNILTPGSQACETCENDDSDKTYSPGIINELFKGYRKSRRLTFDEKVKPVYLELAELLMQQANTVQDGKENKLLEIRDTMELFKAAELQDFFEDECVTAFKSKTKITGMNRTPPHTALIYPILLPESPTLLLIFPDSIKHAPLPVDTETLRQTAKSLRSLLDIRSKQHIKSPNRYRKSASELYNWLIKPVETDLAAREIDTLIIAPDSTLRVIPFSVLLDDNEKFLIEKYALATIPAITLTDFESFERDSINPLLSGLSEGIPPLPNVPNELNAVRTVIGGKILLNKEFTFDNLTSELINEPYSFIVMATHNKFAHTLENTYLQIYDDKGELGKLTMNELEEFISISRFREKKVDLLTLSACETAMGDERAALGLGGIAVKSGAKSAIATLWSVADDAAPLIITEFFRQLKTSDVSKAKALQKAQKKILSEHPDYSHPTYWAPFLLVGNWL